MEDDGIEDLHFYFVSFNNHKSRVLVNQELSKFKKNKTEKHKPKKQIAHKTKSTNYGTEGKEQIKTIESMSDCELDWYMTWL